MEHVCIPLSKSNIIHSLIDGGHCQVDSCHAWLAGDLTAEIAVPYARKLIPTNDNTENAH